jgi:hypothetical protein
VKRKKNAGPFLYTRSGTLFSERKDYTRSWDHRDIGFPLLTPFVRPLFYPHSPEQELIRFLSTIPYRSIKKRPSLQEMAFSLKI